MKILISGSSGLVGQGLISTFANEGQQGIATGRRPPANLPAGWLGRERLPTRANLAADGLPDVVIHLEVKQHVFHPTRSDVQEFRDINVGGTLEWLQWCTRYGISRFVLFSSIKAVRPERYGTTTEDAAGPGDGDYAASKWQAEQLVQQWCAADEARTAVILRPAVVYGEGSIGNIGAMANAIRRRRFFLVGPNCNVKSLVSMRNLAGAVRHLIATMAPGRCEIYNVVDRESFSVRQLDRMLRSHLGLSGNSPALPRILAKGLAISGDLGHMLTGRMLPLNSQRLAALLEHTHFSAQKLMATGFVHRETTEDGLRALVSSSGRRVES